jgi:phospholipase/lecithinase/hemolysin
MPLSSHLERLIWFGDSLTDERTIHDLTERATIVTLPSEPSGYGEAFTNGEVHATVTSELLGVTDDNYAVGYGHALGSYTLEQYAEDRFAPQVPPGFDIFQPDAAQEDLDFDLYLGGQVQRYLQDYFADGPVPGTAAAFCIGLNDYSEFMPTSPELAQAEGAALVAGVVGATITAAATVAATGVETILLCNLPSVRFFPLSTLQTPESLALGDQLIAAHNGALAQGAALLEFGGVNVEIIDFNRMAGELMADPGTFGLRPGLFDEPVVFGTGANPTLVELPDGSYQPYFPPNPLLAGVDPDQVAFMDFVHPSAAVHGVLGVFSAATLTSQTLFFGDGDDTIAGTNGDDLILAGAGSDRVDADPGNDVILAGLGDDTVSGGNGRDIVSGGSGADSLWGGRGADVIADGAGDDEARGSRGSDLLIDGAGWDLIYGGKGADAIIFVEPALRAVQGHSAGGSIYGGSGSDTAYLILDDATRAAVEAELVAGAHNQTLSAIDLTTRGIESFAFLSPDDSLGAIDTPAPIDEADLWGLI